MNLFWGPLGRGRLIFFATATIRKILLQRENRVHKSGAGHRNLLQALMTKVTNAVVEEPTPVTMLGSSQHSCNRAFAAPRSAPQSPCRARHRRRACSSDSTEARSNRQD